MSKELLREFYRVVDSTRIKEIDKESEFMCIPWLEVLEARISKIESLMSEPSLRNYFFPSEIKTIEKKIRRAKRMHAAMLRARNSGSGILHKNTKRKLCRIRSLRSFVS